MQFGSRSAAARAALIASLALAAPSIARAQGEPDEADFKARNNAEKFDTGDADIDRFLGEQKKLAEDANASVAKVNEMTGKVRKVALTVGDATYDVSKVLLGGGIGLPVVLFLLVMLWNFTIGGYLKRRKSMRLVAALVKKTPDIVGSPGTELEFAL